MPTERQGQHQEFKIVLVLVIQAVQETKVEGNQVQGPPALHNETPSQTNNEQTNKQ